MDPDPVCKYRNPEKGSNLTTAYLKSARLIKLFARRVILIL